MPKGALSNKDLSLSQEGTLVAFQKPEQHRQTMRGQSQVSAGRLTSVTLSSCRPQLNLEGRFCLFCQVGSPLLASPSESVEATKWRGNADP